MKTTDDILKAALNRCCEHHTSDKSWPTDPIKRLDDRHETRRSDMDKLFLEMTAVNDEEKAEECPCP